MCESQQTGRYLFPMIVTVAFSIRSCSVRRRVDLRLDYLARENCRLLSLKTFGQPFNDTCPNLPETSKSFFVFG